MTTHVWIAQIIMDHFEYIFDDTPEGRRNAWIVISKYASDYIIPLTPNGEKLYKILLTTYHPLLQIATDNELHIYKRDHFHGGCNDSVNTKEENLFYKMFPYLQKQCSFGTGVGGYKTYGVKRYIADFVDDQANVVIEIDGKSHQKAYNRLKDTIRDYFFYQKGYETVRFSNEAVRNLFKAYSNLMAEALKHYHNPDLQKILQELEEKV